MPSPTRIIACVTIHVGLYNGVFVALDQVTPWAMAPVFSPPNANA
jgi:hypothetical protein